MPATPSQEHLLCPPLDLQPAFLLNIAGRCCCSLLLLLLVLLVHVVACCCCLLLLPVFVACCCCLLVPVAGCVVVLVVVVCVCGWVCSRFLVLSAGPPLQPPLRRTAQNFALFSTSPAENFILSSLSGGSSRGIVAAVQGHGPPKMRLGQPESPNVPNRHPDRHKKSVMVAGEGKKSAKFWAPTLRARWFGLPWTTFRRTPPSTGPLTLRGPTLRAPFFLGWACTLVAKPTLAKPTLAKPTLAKPTLANFTVSISCFSKKERTTKKHGRTSTLCPEACRVNTDFGQTDFGQTDFGRRYPTDFGQTDFGQTDFGPN